MIIQAEISVYPLRIKNLDEPISEVIEIFKSFGLQTQVSTMSSHITGDAEMFFDACKKVFEAAGKKYQLVVNIKVSNACPMKYN